ncbi:MAG TPA: cytidine deaminase [Microscillaceae bacterium]|nr:cytidine deaminase [Microscillaceae bacterium]
MSQKVNKTSDLNNSPKKNLKITISIEVYNNASELSAPDQQLLQEAKEATHSAYAPYSQFFVGSAILLEDETVVRGNNQENAAYPSGICAERTAIYYTGAQYPNTAIKAIAVVARRDTSEYLPAAPCGACRQAMLEYEEKQATPIKLILQGEGEKVYVLNSVSDLLPLKFGKDNLEQ